MERRDLNKTGLSPRQIGAPTTNAQHTVPSFNLLTLEPLRKRLRHANGFSRFDIDGRHFRLGQ